MPSYVTDANPRLNLSFVPKRIVSLVPSQTELLYSLGLDEEVVGLTKFCVHPSRWFRKKQRVGGTKTVSIEVVKALQPDLIIANKEENVKEQIEELEKLAPVWISDIKTLDDALEMIISVGKLVHRESRATDLIIAIRKAFEQIEPLRVPLSSAYLIWKDPYMAVAADSFIHDMLSRCGLTNMFKHVTRYPEVSIKKFSNNAERLMSNPPSAVTVNLSTLNSSLSVNSHLQPARDITTENCQLLLLSSEPYPFAQKHVTELQTLLPFTKIILVDGEMFSWYGSRLLYSPQYLKNLIQQIQG